VTEREFIQSVTAMVESVTAVAEENNETLKGICRELGLIEDSPRPSLSLAKV
jgi:hypothetical protein